MRTKPLPAVAFIAMVMGAIIVLSFALGEIDRGEARAARHVWSADDIPMVHLQDHRRYVCDPDTLLSPTARSEADAALMQLHGLGVQTVMIVCRRVKDGDCFRMAQDVGNRYGVGTSRERRGLVVVIATDDRRYFIAPGRGLEGDLTDVECNDIARQCIVANMRNGQTDSAVVQTAQALRATIYNKVGSSIISSPTTQGSPAVRDNSPASPGNSPASPSGKSSKGDQGGFGIVLGAIIGLVLLVILIRAIMVRPRHRRSSDAGMWIPPFFFGGGGFGHGHDDYGGFDDFGGSFGGGSFGGGGAGGGW